MLSSASLHHSLTQVNYHQMQLVVSMAKTEQRRINGVLRKCYAEEHFSSALDWKLSVHAEVRALADNFELGVSPILVSSVPAAFLCVAYQFILVTKKP